MKSLKSVFLVAVVSSFMAISANAGSAEGDTTRWNINRLAAGDSRTFAITLTTREIGTFCNRVTASESANGLRVSDQACTEWCAPPTLTIDAIDLVDPLGVGEETTYVVRSPQV